MAGYETTTKTIGGLQYDITKLGAKVASRMLVKLAKSVGPLFMMAAGRQMTPASATEAMKGLSEEDFDWCLEQFASRAVVHLPDGKAPSLGSPGVFDMHFSGKYSELMEFVEASVDENFGPFFREIKARLPQNRVAAAPVPSPSTSPST